MASTRPRLLPAVADARRAVAATLTDLDPAALVLVALSGGADSLALLVSAVFVAQRHALRCGAVVVDHRLQEGSGAVAEAAAEQARSCGADPVELVSVTVEGPGGPEAAARAARRAALETAAARLGAVAVLLGHTLDDQAETVLLGLARGSGARSLAGMREVDGLWRRPLLRLDRAQSVEICRWAGLSWWDDPHNGDLAYTRVRVRRTVLPVLETELGPGVATALARSADLLRADADLLEDLAAGLAAQVTRPDGSLDAEALAAAPLALRSRVLRAAATAVGCPATDLGATHVRALDALLFGWHGRAGVDLPGGVRAERVAGSLRWMPPGVAG
ncbi:MAG: tRNA lysidine(34) synthetase TilS [Nocardioidaceae bacterium]